jgi:general secretion pathway protein E
MVGLVSSGGATPPGRLLTNVDGLQIASEIRDYIAVIMTGSEVVIYVDANKRGLPALIGLEQWLKRRPKDYRSVRVEPVAYDEVHELREKFGDQEADTISMERTAIEVLRLAYTLNASDMHILQHHNNEVVVHFRIDGDLIPSEHRFSPDDASRLLQAYYTMADDGSKKGSYSTSDFDDAAIVKNLTRYDLDTYYSAIRLHWGVTILGPELQARFTPRVTTFRNLEKIGFAPAVLRDLRAIIHAPGGGLFISGPTGSGKTRTWATCIDDFCLQHPYRHVVTVEDPVEAQLLKASQHQVNEKDDELRARKYLKLLRAVVREDFDLLGVGECRDSQGACAFMNGLILGRVGLTSIHSPSATLIVDKLLGWGIDSAALRNPTIIAGLMGVRLVRTLCSHCRIPIDEALDSAGAQHLHDSVNRLQRHANQAFTLRKMPVPDVRQGYRRNATGCRHCRRPATSGIRTVGGTTGRIQVAELIRCDIPYLDHAAAGRFEEAERYLRTALGVPSLFEDAILRVAAGEICPLDAEAAIGEFPVPASHRLSIAS